MTGFLFFAVLVVFVAVLQDWYSEVVLATCLAPSDTATSYQANALTALIRLDSRVWIGQAICNWPTTRRTTG